MMNLIDPPRVFRKRRNGFGTSLIGLIGLGAFLTVAGLLFLTTGHLRRVENYVLTRPEKTSVGQVQGLVREEAHNPDQIVDGFPAAYQKVQLSDWPSLRAFHHINLLTKKETEYIIGLAAAHLARSQVVGTTKDANNGGGVVSDVRTSQGMFLQSYEHRSDPVVIAFRDRISRTTGFPERNMEATQVLKYQGGEFYRTHPDYFDMDIKELEKRGGNRVCTVLCYLNTPEIGGATTFPAVNVTVPAIAGNCVEFYSMKSDGSPDPLSWHGALPPGQGVVKWSMPTWIRASEFR